MSRGLEHFLYKENLRDPRLLSLENRLRRDLGNTWKYLKFRHHKDGDTIFSAVPSKRTKRNGHKVERRKFHRNMR